MSSSELKPIAFIDRRLSCRDVDDSHAIGQSKSGIMCWCCLAFMISPMPDLSSLKLTPTGDSRLEMTQMWTSWSY